MSAPEQETKNEDSHNKAAIRTWLRLLSCETVIEQKLRTLFRTEFSVTLPQFDVLSELERTGKPMTMSELSIGLMVSNGNVTGVIDRLERNGLVTRTRAKHDRRIQYIELTVQGRKDFNNMAQHHEGWVGDILDKLSDEDMSHLQELLLKTRNAITEQ